MAFLLLRVLTQLARRSRWATPILVIGFVFLTSWPLMALAEPYGSELVQPANYWWYFVVTAATIGYGDYFPKTGGGHVVGAYVIVGGMTALTTVFAKIASMIERTRGQRMRGAITVDDSDHTVLLGYTPGRTEAIIDELLADNGRTIVLCASDEVSTHPLPERGVRFVRGDLTRQDVLLRAGLDRAAVVLVDARDDNEALAVTVTADHVSSNPHLVVTLRDMERAHLVQFVSKNVRCVQWHSPRMITEELTSPGIAEVYSELMTAGGPNTYSVALPTSLGTVLVEHCQTELGRRHGATLLAARADGRLLVNPSWDTELPAGCLLYYVGSRRLNPEEIVQAITA